MSNVIDFPVKKREAEVAKEDEHFEFAVNQIQEGTNALLHELDRDDALDWHRANIVETMIMELMYDLLVGASIDNEGAIAAIKWLCEEFTEENVNNAVENMKMLDATIH
jgi:hypothetical protein